MCFPPLLEIAVQKLGLNLFILLYEGEGGIEVQ